MRRQRIFRNGQLVALVAGVSLFLLDGREGFQALTAATVEGPRSAGQLVSFQSLAETIQGQT
jgi:hypothetical protein